MKKIIILIPIFNDWESLSKLIKQISFHMEKLKNYQINLIIINDGSTISRPEIIIPKNINSIKIINMKINKGHTTCIAFGFYYVTNNEKFDNLILMDGDGEDRPEEIKMLIDKSLSNQGKSTVAKRFKRSEGMLFKIFYNLHKLITLIFTGHKINFGNFTLLSKEDVLIMSKKPNLWNSYSGTFKKYIKNYKEIDSIRGNRYFGPSKMSLFKLLLHSFSIIASFKYNVYLRSTFMIIILAYLITYFGNTAILLQISIVIFNLIIFLISQKKLEKNLSKTQLNLANVEDIAH